jgi:hypothetical protein
VVRSDYSVRPASHGTTASIRNAEKMTSGRCLEDSDATHRLDRSLSRAEQTRDVRGLTACGRTAHRRGSRIRSALDGKLRLDWSDRLSVVLPPLGEQSFDFGVRGT